MNFPNKTIFYVFFFLFSIPIHTHQPQSYQQKTGRSQNSEHGNVVCITTPKCGTNMLHKLLTSMKIPGIKLDYATPLKPPHQVKKLNKFYPPYHYKGPYHVGTHGNVPQSLVTCLQNLRAIRSYSSHWTFTQEFEEFLFKNSYANFFIIRDPRDQVVSMAHMISKGFEHGQNAPVEKILLDLIDGRQQNFVLWGVEVNGTYPLEWELGVVNYFRLYLPWMNARKFYTVRFENLVGPLGGGSLETQLQEIKNIAAHLGYPLSDEKALKLAQELFGDSKTFREGQIGSWKKHFTPEMKIAFKASGGDELLIELGYEKDKNW